jgi:maltose alpha-D-glucosyltransferase/alpha-amylase
MNGLLFSFPGTPIVYYGDEIGMGDNIYLGDRNGVRTPMQWSADRNAGFSRANPQQLYLPTIIDPQYHYEQVNVEAQQASQHSLLWWMKRLISTRKRYKAFGRGSIEFLQPENRKILAFVRRYEEETILVVANLSRLVQAFELDLSGYRGMVPVEMSGGTRFPEVADRPYFLNLGPYAFYWFALEKQRDEVALTSEEVPVVAAKSIRELVTRDAFSKALLRYIRARRWFAGKARTVSTMTITQAIPLAKDSASLAFVQIEYTEGEAETYLVPLAITHDAVANPIARLRDGGLVYEPVTDERFATNLLELVARRRQIKTSGGELAGVPSRVFRELLGEAEIHPQVLRAEQSNTAIVYGDRLFMKLFRRLEPGVNTDLEITRFLNEETSFEATPKLAGAIEYETAAGGEPTTIALVQSFTPNSGDAWRYTLDSIGRYFERVLSGSSAGEDAFANYIRDAQQLGRRTAQLHAALASRGDIPAFAPEPITPHYQRSVYQHIRTQAVHTMQLLRRRAKGVAEAEQLLARDADLQKKIRAVLDGKIGGQRIRTHGDYHLGQVLYTGKDFVIIDFEGEPSRPLSERRIKRSALRDVAGMLRSFDYAPYALIYGQSQGSVIRGEDIPKLEAAGKPWVRAVSEAFLNAYIAESASTQHLPRTKEEFIVLLNAHLLEKALYEIAYELNNRPEWVRIPLRGVLDLLG